MDKNNKKNLVVYFSHKGQNYFNGRIIDLAIGNTEVAAEIISKLTDADMFKVESVQEYPKDYNKCTMVAQAELRENARPRLASDINTDQYDVIYLGYPNWWGTMPMVLWTFLESHNLAGKIIYPFCTHEGSGMGKSESDIRRLCPNSEIKRGLAIDGSSVKKAETNIKNWTMKG